MLSLLDAFLRSLNGDNVAVVVDARNADLRSSGLLEVTQFISFLSQDPTMMIAWNRELLAGLSLEVNEDFAACFGDFIGFAGDEESQGLILATGDFNMSSSLLHDGLARAQRLAFAELVVLKFAFG